MSTQLTELEAKSAKPKKDKFTLSAGQGLALLVMPNGSKYWRLRYRVGAKPRMISVGKPYPETTLKQARTEAAALRAMVESGTDPADRRRADKLATRERVAHTFGQAAEAWHAFRSKAWKPRTAAQVREYMDKDMLPKLRSRPLDAITAPELGALVAGIERRGALDVAGKVRQWLKSIYSFARANGWTDRDPPRDLLAIALPKPKAKNYPHLPLAELPAFLRAVNAYDGSPLVKACAWLALWTANRPGIVRTLQWSEVDLDAALWTIQPGREGMKRGYYHVTPLPSQAVAMLRGLHAQTGWADYVLPGRNDPHKPMSDGSVARMIKALGYNHKQTMHGFRHLISTALNDQGYQADWVERQLAHGDPDKIRGTYNKAAYLEPRRRMMQSWADMLDRMVKGGNVVPLAEHRKGKV